jgi:hypothetical protein
MAARLDLIAYGGNVPQYNTVQNLPTPEREEKRTEIDEEGLKRSKTVYTWLKPIDMESEQYHFQQIRARWPPGTAPGRWLLDNMTFREWFDPQFTALPTLLWLHGNPGAGMCIISELITAY